MHRRGRAFFTEPPTACQTTNFLGNRRRRNTWGRFSHSQCRWPFSFNRSIPRLDNSWSRRCSHGPPYSVRRTSQNHIDPGNWFKSTYMPHQNILKYLPHTTITSTIWDSFGNRCSGAYTKNAIGRHNSYSTPRSTNSASTNSKNFHNSKFLLGMENSLQNHGCQPH